MPVFPEVEIIGWIGTTLVIIAYYPQIHHLSVAGMNRDRELASFEEKLRLNQMPLSEQSKENLIVEKAFRCVPGLF